MATEYMKYSSSVETLEANRSRRERENASPDYDYAEDVLGSDIVDSYRSASEEYNAIEERNEEIREQNEKIKQHNDELDAEFAATHNGRSLDEENEWRRQENERIRKNNEQHKANNERIAEENAQHIAEGKPWLCQKYEEYEAEWEEATIDYEDTIDEEQYRAMEGFLPAKTEQEAILQKWAADVMFSGKKVGAWVDFWEAIDKSAPSIMKGVDTVKTGLLAAVDALEYLVDSLKQLVDILSGIIGKALQMASLAVMLAKALIATIQQLINQLLKLLEFAILKSEMKLTTFNLWPMVVPNKTQSGLKVPSKIDQMAPALNAVFNEMATQRFNRPIAENSLCFAMLLPCSFSKETAEAIGKTARLIDLFGTASWDDFRNNRILRKEAEIDYPPFLGGELIVTIQDMTKEFGFSSKASRNPGKGQERIDAMCTSCIEQLEAMFKPAPKLGEALKKAYDHLAKEEEAAVSSNGIAWESIPGTLYCISAKEKSEGEILIENNFINNRSHYIASIYRVPTPSTNKGVRATKKIFFDPSFLFAQAITASGVRKFIEDVIKLFRAGVQWWYSRKVWSPTAEEHNLKKALDTTFAEFFGDNTFSHYATGYPAVLASDSLLFIHALRQIIKQKEGDFKALVDEYEGQKQEELAYTFRASVNPSVPRVRPSFTLKNVDAAVDDKLVFVLVSDRGVYYPHDLLASEDHNSAYYSSLTPGDLNENMDVKMVKNIVWDKNAIMIKPRWYDLQDPNGADDFTLSWLLNQAGIREYLGVPMQVLKSVERYLDAGLDGMNAFKEMFDSWVAVFDRYYGAIKDVIAAIRKMLLVFGLPNLPSIYVVTWQGGIKDLPSVMMSALAEIGMENSTYAGVVLFGSAEASSEFIELYHTQMLTKESIEKMREDSARAWEDTTGLADEISKLGASIGDIDWIGLNAYNEKKEAEKEEKEREEREKYWNERRQTLAKTAGRLRVSLIADEDIHILHVTPLKVPMRETNIESDICRDEQVDRELLRLIREKENDAADS